MQILYDYKIFIRQNHGGISRYFCNLYTEINKLNKIDINICSLMHQNTALKEIKTNSFNFYMPKLTNKDYTIMKIINANFLKVYSSLYPPNIIHETFYSNETSNKKVKVCLTVFDLIDEIFYAKDPLKINAFKEKKESIIRADHIICISKQTKNDLIKFYKVPEEKISITYLAAEKHFFQKEYTQQFNFPFILFVGGRGGYKNFLNLVKAYMQSSYLKKNFYIVCFGGGPCFREEMETYIQLGIKEKSIIFVNGNDEYLKNLYKSAEALVYPSLYEGFGIPPLEAMACGCPVISSNKGSLKEVIGNASQLIDPKCPEEISKNIEKVLFSTSLKKKLVQKGIFRAKKFSWETCGNETLEIYNKLNNNLLY